MQSRLSLFAAVAVTIASSSSSSSLFAFAQTDPWNCSQVPSSAFDRILLTNSQGSLTLAFIPYGGTVVNMYVRDETGYMRDVLLGYDDTTQYCSGQHPYFGALVGRIANRIGGNGTFMLDGSTITVPINEPWTSGCTNNYVCGDSLHGGTVGFDRRVWNVTLTNSSSAVLQYSSPDGEMGYPGDLDVSVVYTITENDSWVIQYTATASTKDTVVALTQHAYWQLDGIAQQVVNQTMTIPNGNSYLVVDEHLIPTGEVAPVTPCLDFTFPKQVGRDIAQGTVTPVGGYDNAIVLNASWSPNNAIPALAAVVSSEVSHLEMFVYTDQPSMQFYSGNFLNGSIPAKASQGGGSYPHWGAVVLEAQRFPDGVNNPQWGPPGSAFLAKGDTYTQTTIYHFERV